MMKKLLISIALLSTAVLPLRAQAAGSLSDQYRQMGSVAAVAEICLQSLAIPDALNTAMASAERKDPRAAPLLQPLVEEYNTAYIHAAQHQRLWNGTQQAYSQVPLDCAKAEDRERLRGFETLILQQLRGN